MRYLLLQLYKTQLEQQRRLYAAFNRNSLTENSTDIPNTTKQLSENLHTVTYSQISRLLCIMQALKDPT